MGAFLLAALDPAAPALAQSERAVGLVPRNAGERRVALVIGNSNYEASMGKLVNPANDARDMAWALKQLGFEVTHRQDVDRRQFEAAVEAFRANVRDASIAVFYFAGHGVQVDNVNYLVPLEAKLKTQLDAKYRGIDASWVVEAMQEGGAKASIVILDACRNNPLPKGGRSGSRGLAVMQSGTGSLIAFAASPGQVADENVSGRNGLYTEELLRYLHTPGISAPEVFQRTREGVYRRSNQRQTPQDWNALVGGVYLAGGSGEPPPPPPPPLPPPPNGTDLLVYGMLGLGGVLGVYAVLQFQEANDLQDEAQSVCGSDPDRCTQLQDDRDAAVRNALTAAVVGAGLIWAALRDSDAGSSQNPRGALLQAWPMLTADDRGRSAGVFLRLRW
jgi:hypothetical protein